MPLVTAQDGTVSGVALSFYNYINRTGLLVIYPEYLTKQVLKLG